MSRGSLLVRLYNNHRRIADFRMVVIVRGQNLTACPPEGVSAGINTYSLPSPQMGKQYNISLRKLVLCQNQTILPMFVFPLLVFASFASLIQ